MIINNTGYEWDYIENKLTLPRLNAMQKNWKKNGSTYLNTLKVKFMVESYLGITDNTEDAKVEESIDDFMKAFGAMGGTVG